MRLNPVWSQQNSITLNSGFFVPESQSTAWPETQTNARTVGIKQAYKSVLTAVGEGGVEQSEGP